MTGRQHILKSTQFLSSLLLMYGFVATFHT